MPDATDKDVRRRAPRALRVFRVRSTGNTYGVAFGAHIYAAVDRSPPLALYKCTKSEPLPFYSKQGGESEDFHDVTEESCALPGAILVADLERKGWVRITGGTAERWLPLDGGYLERLERPTSSEPLQVPPGWEVLTWQACQGAVLKAVIAGFEWGATGVVVQDTVQARFLRVGTAKSDRPGSILGDANHISIAADGTVSPVEGAVVLITRPMIGIAWGEDMFDVSGLLDDPGYAAAASSGFSVRPAQRDLEAEAIEAGHQALAAEVRGWFSPSPPSTAELVRISTQKAVALRRLWAHDLQELRLLRVHEGFVQLPELGAGEGDEADPAEARTIAAAAAAAEAAEEEFDPIQIWVQVALGSILELAACIAPREGQTESSAFERLITRGTQSFASAAPLSLFGAGRTSKLCVEETMSALESLVLSMPSLRPAALEMLMSVAAVTGSARLIAQALQWLLSGADEACASRCVPSLAVLWRLGSAMHFETMRVQDKTDKRVVDRKNNSTWKFAYLRSLSRITSTVQRIRSHRAISFEEPLPGGVYWEVTCVIGDLQHLVVGIWLESKKKAIGCRASDAAAVGAGAESNLAEPLPESESGSVFGILATAEELVVNLNGAAFTRVTYGKLLAPGERVAVFVEAGSATQIHINIGQEPFQHPPADMEPWEVLAPTLEDEAVEALVGGASRVGDGSPANSALAQEPANVSSSPPPRPLPWGRACDQRSISPYEPFANGVEPRSPDEVASILLQITERNVGRLGSSVDIGTPVQHTFARSDQMSIAEDGMVVSNVRENSWARVDCEITVGVSVEFSFEVLDDRENDEGTCYGISTAECTKYDGRGAFVVRGYSGHLYCDGSDKGEKFQKVHPRSRVSFRFDYSEGRLEAWLDDQEPRLLISDPVHFQGRTFYPTVFNYHGTRTKVKLLSCNSGFRSRAMLQDSFALEVSAPAAALWVDILEQLLVPVRSLPLGSPKAVMAAGPVAIVLKVLLATANVSLNIWQEFGPIRSRLMDMIEFMVIERRHDQALQQPRDICILLISVLGVGALFGGPEQVLKVFLSVRDSEASRLGQTLVAYLLRSRRATPVAKPLMLSLSKLAVTDELACQILLRFALNAFAEGAERLATVAHGVLGMAASALRGAAAGDTDANGGSEQVEDAAAEPAANVQNMAAAPAEKRGSSANCPAAEEQPTQGSPSRSLPTPERQTRCGGGGIAIAADGALPSFVSDLLPVFAQLLAALPRREPMALSVLLGLLVPVVRVLGVCRGLGTAPSAAVPPAYDAAEGELCNVPVEAMAVLGRGASSTGGGAGRASTPRCVRDTMQGLSAFVCGVAGVLLAGPGAESKPFPLDISGAELRDSTVNLPLPKALVDAEAVVDEIAGPKPCPMAECSPVPEIVMEILDGTGRGEELVSDLHSKSLGHQQPVTAVQRAAFAAALLCRGPDAWEATAEDSASGAAAWQAAQVFMQNKVRPMKHSIAANEGDAAVFEADIAEALAWLVRSLLCTEDAPAPSQIGRGIMAPASLRQKGATKFSVAERMRFFGRVHAFDGQGLPMDVRLDLSHAQSQLVDEAMGMTSTSASGTGRADPGSKHSVGTVAGGAQSGSASGSFGPMGNAGAAIGAGAAATGSAASVGSNASSTTRLITAVAAHNVVAAGRRTGLRLLRFLVRGAVGAEEIELLLPVLHAALEDTLARPLAGMQHSTISLKRAALAELSGLLREVHDHCVQRAVCPTASALSLAMMCVPLSRDEFEPLLGDDLLKSLPTLALDGYGTVGHCRTHAAQLVLRAYICARGSAGPIFASMLAQVATLLDSVPSPWTSPPTERPLPTDACTDPLEVDWDFGAFGRLCPREFDFKVLADELSQVAAVASSGDQAQHLDDNTKFEQSHAMSLSLQELRRHRAMCTLSPDIAAGLLLRLPQGAREEAKVDPIEAMQVLRASRGADVPWPGDRWPGTCVAALTLLRPVAELLHSEVPNMAEKLLSVASCIRNSSGGGCCALAASLAICLYLKLQLPDERVGDDAPGLLAMLGEAQKIAASVPASAVPGGVSAPARCRGTLAFASLLARQLALRAGAMSDAVLASLSSLMAGQPLSDGTFAALDLVGGPPQCAACQMQVLSTSFGRSLVVAADAQHVAVLSLDGATDAKAIQWVQWNDLQVPHRDVSVASCVGRASPWGEDVVNCLLSAVQHLLSSGGHGAKSRRSSTRSPRIPPQLLRALAAVLPTAPCWDVAIVTEAVRELDELAAAGVGDLIGGPAELLEHRCTLLRLALRRERLLAVQTGLGELLPSPSCSTGPHGQEAAIAESAAVPSVTVGGGADPQPTVAGAQPSLLDVLNQGAEWRGRYKLKRHTNTWFKVKWHMELRFVFHADGTFDVVARWPKFPQPSTGQQARWRIEGGYGLCVDFDLELPGGRREGGRARDCETFSWSGRLVQSRGCPHLEGTASGRLSDLKYEWYVVPPDPLAVLRAVELDFFGKPDESIPRPFSLLSFNTGFVEQKAEHFSGTLGLSNFTKSDGTAHDLASAAVDQLHHYQYIIGPREVAKVAKQSPEETWGMRDSFEEEDEGMPGNTLSLEDRWCPLGEALGQTCGAGIDVGSGSSDSIAGSGVLRLQAVAASLEREERQLRHALLMRLLQVMLAHRPTDAAIADSFCDHAARGAFFRRALRLPDATAVLKRCAEDFACSPDVTRSALAVAVEGLLTPFMAGGVSTLTVESDHDYHQNEDWVFKLSIPGASRMRVKFDSRCRTENNRDFLQFFGERDPQGLFSRRLHNEEKLCGQYPAAFPDLHVPGDCAWMRFKSDGSEQFWGFKFTLSGEGGGAYAAAVPFAAALKLLVSIAGAVPEADRPGMRLMGASVLLSVAATQPLSDEATRAAESMCELLPEPCPWSDHSWCAALSLMSVAERSGRRQLLASLVTLLSSQMGPRIALGDGCTPPALLLDRVVPDCGGVLMNGRTTLVSGTCGRTRALGLPVPMQARAGHALFCVRVEPWSADGATIGVGVAPVMLADDGDALDVATCREALSDALPGDEFNVEVQRHGLDGDCFRLVLSGTRGGGNGSTWHQQELPFAWRDAVELVPVLWAEGFGAALTLRPPPSASRDSEAAAGRLEQLRRAGRLVEACRGGRGTQLPSALVAGSWVRREGGDEADIAEVQKRLHARCTAVVESAHPHRWCAAAEKLEVPGASALELSFPRVELADGYRLHVTHDAQGDLSVMEPSRPTNDVGAKRFVEFGVHLYATVDDADPESRERAQQDGWLNVPLGWELTPAKPEVVDEVIAKHRWATDVLVCGSGEAFYTLNFDHGNKAGQSAGADRLASRGPDSLAEHRPIGVRGRILIRRTKLGALNHGQASPLIAEELASGEHVVVPGSAVYIHGPVPQLPRWDADGAAEYGDLFGGPDAASIAPLAPSLCPGPWVWTLSPTRQVVLSLTPAGTVKLVSTTLDWMSVAELEEVRGVMAACGEAIVQPSASWVDSSKFRLARVFGNWNVDDEPCLKVRLEGADDLGTVQLAFTSKDAPSLDENGGVVAVAGEVVHTRWDQHRVVLEGRSALSARIVSLWPYPEFQDSSMEVQVCAHDGPPAAICIRTLGSSELLLHGSNVGNVMPTGPKPLVAGSAQRDDVATVGDDESSRGQASEQSVSCQEEVAQQRPVAGDTAAALGGGGGAGDATSWADATVRRSLVLDQDEYVERVCGSAGCAGQESPWLEVRTNRGRTLAWPPSRQFSLDNAKPIEHSASEYCEISRVNVSVGGLSDLPAALNVKCRPLALGRCPPFELRRFPEGLWEGRLEIEGQKPHAVRCRLAMGGMRGTFSASFESVELSAVGTALGTLTCGEITSSGSVRAMFAGGPSAGLGGPLGRAVEGRCTVDRLQRATIVLITPFEPRPTAQSDGGGGSTEPAVLAAAVPSMAPAIRMVLRSKVASTAAYKHAALTLDGPNLVYRADGATQRHLMHTARAPWTQQIATDCAVVELKVEQLAAGGEAGGSGLIIGVADPRPGGGAEPLVLWPGKRSGRWLWRSDGAIANVPASDQQSSLWRYKVGDVVGFAVGPLEVSFLRNGERVHSVPRHVRGDEASLGQSSLPVLVVGLSCDTVLRLCDGMQCLRLCEDANTPHLRGDDTCCGSLDRVVGGLARPIGGRFHPPPRSSVAADPPQSVHIVAGVPLRRRLRRCVLMVIWLNLAIKKTFKGHVMWPHSGKSHNDGSVAGSGVVPNVWVETTLVGTEACPAKGRTILEELGGEDAIKVLVSSWHGLGRSVSAQNAMTPEDIQELFVNEYCPASIDRVGSARMSVKTTPTASVGEWFRAFRLECCQAAPEWRIVEMLSDGSGLSGQCKGIWSIAPGSEVLANEVQDGWLRSEQKVTDGIQTLWLPVCGGKDGLHPRFARRDDLVIQEEPVFKHVAMKSFRGPSPCSEASVNDSLATVAMPAQGMPYTVEAYVRIPKEECGQEMCIIAWESDSVESAVCGLSICDTVLATPCGLRTNKCICDGIWHHVACTFDGKERVLWVDFEPCVRATSSVGTTAVAASPSLEAVERPPSEGVALRIGAYSKCLAENRRTPGDLRGDIKRINVWRSAIGPALLRSNAAKVEAQVRDAVAVEAAKAVFGGLDARGDGSLGPKDFEAVFGRSKDYFFKRVDRDSRGSIGLEEWLLFCKGVKEARGEQHLTQFLRACARNLGQRRRALHVKADWEHALELPSELSLTSSSWGWRAEAKPVSLSDAMLESIKDEGIERFRCQVRATHALLGHGADEAIVELADRVALQQGNHDDCWSKMIAVGEWSQAQPRWTQQAVAQVKLEDMTVQAKLQEVLAWANACGKPPSEALGPQLRGRLARPRAEELLREAERSSGSVQAYAGLATELLLPPEGGGHNPNGSSSSTAPANAPSSSSSSAPPPGGEDVGAAADVDEKTVEAAVEAIFHDTISSMLFYRFLVLLELNRVVAQDFLPLVDLAAPADSAYGRLLAQVKPRLLGHLKFSQFQHVLQNTRYEGSTPNIILNRKAALSLRERGRVDWEFRRSLTGQLMAEFRRQNGGPKLFRRPWQSRCMKVQFKGEGGEDAGGLYREALDAVAQELHSGVVPLLVPCPNAVAEVGVNRDGWLLNPRAATPECARALEFVGQLLGLALRTGDLLPLTLAPFTWKGIVGDERTRDDVRSIDVFADKHLTILGGDLRLDEDSLGSMGGLVFAYPDVTGEEIELIEGGRNVNVTPGSASEFARLVLDNRLNFDRLQLLALRRGLASVVPTQLLRLWSWRDLQERVCGVPEMDIENLKRHTTYKNCTNTNAHVQYMWEALESFTQKQRRSFLRFVWGRSSLPTVEKWERNFTVQLLPGTDDSRLPCSHTCFFILDLPTYSSSEVCHAKLLYCITNCLAIDADGAAARSLNWDEDDED